MHLCENLEELMLYADEKYEDLKRNEHSCTFLAGNLVSKNKLSEHATSEII
jgi:hypothetical protein